MNTPYNRRKFIQLLGAGAAVSLLPACSSAQTPDSSANSRNNESSNNQGNNNENSANRNDTIAASPLIVYLTRTHNTEVIANMIQAQVGGELLEVKPQTPYPEDYQAHVDQAEAENQRDYLPPLATSTQAVANHDVIYFGFPTWGMRMPPPMKSFLNSANLAGKTIIPFNTNAGFGVGSGFDSVRELAPNSSVLEGLAVEGGYEKRGILLAIQGQRATEVEAQVHDWLQRIQAQSQSQSQSQ